MRNPIIEYYGKICSGEINTSRKIRKTYRKLVWDIEHPDEYFYSPKRAAHAIDFIQNFCKHSKGKFGGKPVILELWELALIAAIFGFIDINGNRKYREVFLVVAKKNGKSLLASAMYSAARLLKPLRMISSHPMTWPQRVMLLLFSVTLRITLLTAI